jgi:hypothetical protein
MLCLTILYLLPCLHCIDIHYTNGISWGSQYYLGDAVNYSIVVAGTDLEIVVANSTLLPGYRLIRHLHNSSVSPWA